MKPIHTKSTLLGIALLGGSMISSQAATVVPIIAYGHNNKDNFGGNILDVYNGSGMNGVVNPANQTSWPPASDPSTWTRSSSAYQDEWQADQLLDTTTSINGKVGWIIMDLGSSIADLDKMYLWNGVQIGTNAMKDFNLYYSNGSPVIPATQGPTGGTAADDYNFGVAAWTKLNTSGVLTLADNNNTTAQGTYTLGGITARYIAIEMMSRHSGNFDPNSGRIGFAEAAFTTIPEPGAALLSGLGVLILLRRKKH